jgi:hypothetical protein
MIKADGLVDKVFIGTLLIVPVYLPLAVLAASNFGSIYLFSAWKELVMIGLLTALVKPLLALLRAKDKTTRLLNITIALYVLLAIPYVFSADSLFEFVAGFLFSTRFLFFFLVAQVLAVRFKLLPERISRIVLIVGTILAGIAVLQAMVLPPTFLQHIGYEPLGVETPGFPPAVTTLGEVDDFIRPQAALRGPNPLGAFLVLPFCLLVWQIASNKRKDLKSGGALLLIGLALLFTFSRSAWLAAFIGTAGVLFYSLRANLRNIKKSWLAIGLAALVVISVFALGNKTMRIIILRE